MLTKEQLIEIGVNPDNTTYPMGEMNVIVQCFGSEDGTEEDYETGEKHQITEVYPGIYMPRKNRVWSCGCVGSGEPIDDEESRKDWCAHLRDSAERLKVMAYYLSKQADEIEKFGYPKTDCYYPE